MRRIVTILAAVLLLSRLGAARAGTTPPVVADLQLRSTDATHWVLHVRSSGPQAFDVVPQHGGTRFVVRLYGAVLGSTPPLGAAPFGTVSVKPDGSGNVTLTIQLATKNWHASAVQGTSANAVDVQVSR